MNRRPESLATHTSRLTLRVEPEFRIQVAQAAEKRDGGNISRLVRRAVDRLIEEEGLLESTAAESKERVA